MASAGVTTIAILTENCASGAILVMRLVLASIAALILVGCGAEASKASPLIPGTPKLEITVTCTDQNTVMFEVKNTGDPIPSSGWVYKITDESGEVVEQ